MTGRGTARPIGAGLDVGDMKKLLIEFSDEMAAAIDAARGKAPRGPFVEGLLRRLKAIRDTADAIGVELPDRPADRRGTWERPKD